MFDDLLEWVKGLLGGATEDVTQGVSNTVEGSFPDVAEEAGSYGQDVAGEAAGGVAETAAEAQEGVNDVGGVMEDPGGAATDYADEQLPGNQK
ncbi:hypothetical protein EFW17_09435 [Halostreptopolyspora alba]|uniref:Antitoxin n=2 Tax=Halostreptopolyspora alba TaxID=2487137 RepID=A0A3N0EBW1_9ACTN|nr:hypothetical protein EFW17_09435 [Nocardiopsaceae bacterium YIM 96095]